MTREDVFENIVALKVLFNGKTIWVEKLDMQEDHALCLTKEQELICVKPEDVLDELTLK